MLQTRRFNILIFLIAIFYGFDCAAQVTFKFSAGTIDAGTLKNKMENNISALLSEINRAGNARSSLNLSSINMEPAAKTRLTALWEDARFVCDKSSNISKCLNDFQGYQVRNIPVTIQSNDSIYTGLRDRELTISLNRNGHITGVRLALELQEDITRILSSPSGIADTRQRREILKWIEDYISFYTEKNIREIAKIFSDDILIITGSEIKQQKSDEEYPVDNEIRYKVLSKDTYLHKLSRNFNKRQKLDFEIDHITVQMHGAKPNIYGVTLHQKWQTNSYCDEGWLFLLWDFNDLERPIIRMRTWRTDPIVTHDDMISIDNLSIHNYE